MAVKGFLKQEQRENLQKAVREDNCALLRERALMLLLMNDGKTYAEISEFIGCGLRTVVYWCVHGDPDNIESLKDQREKGNHSKATDEDIKLLMETIEKPSELGYEFGRWTAARLATYLSEQTGIKLSGEQIRRILLKKKSVYLWAKYSLEDKQDPAKRAAFQQKLGGYIEVSKASPTKLQVWFWDESGFSLRVIRRKNWNQKGQRKKVSQCGLGVSPSEATGEPARVTGQRSSGKVNIMGAVRFHDRKRICYFVEKGNSDIFYSSLQQLYEQVKQEWVEQGNESEDFTEKGPKIFIVLDNASYHKKKTMLAEVETNLPNIQLYFLPPYSPDSNLIKLVWHSAKEYIAHRLFQSVEQLKNLLDRLLNQGQLIIKWYRKLKNKGNAIIAS
ncbi:IS630 family transposase [uncultured Nostoc sp.]|uniref:IS630 family transposase n=1 Tax=uncultured Nostoc sp. TaxID=340711 RepID=UPI00262A99F2|nr:IS630 family transposase [uncultured Nostoc sp.]